MRVVPTAILVACLLYSTTAHSQDYRAEITTHVVDPCIMAAVEHQELDELMDRHEAVTIMKMLMQGTIDGIIDATTTIVRGKDRNTRMAVYPMLRGLCIDSMLNAN